MRHRPDLARTPTPQHTLCPPLPLPLPTGAQICLKRGWAGLTERALALCKMVNHRMWGSQNPLRQFKGLPGDILSKLEKRDIPWERYYDMSSQELGELIRAPKHGKTLHRLVHQFPRLSLAAHVQPVTRTLLKLDITITPDFKWDDKVHGFVEPWWVWVEDADGERLLHHQYWVLKKSFAEEEHTLSFTVGGGWGDGGGGNAWWGAVRLEGGAHKHHNTAAHAHTAPTYPSRGCMCYCCMCPAPLPPSIQHATFNTQHATHTHDVAAACALCVLPPAGARERAAAPPVLCARGERPLAAGGGGAACVVPPPHPTRQVPAPHGAAGPAAPARHRAAQPRVRGHVQVRGGGDREEGLEEGNWLGET